MARPIVMPSFAMYTAEGTLSSWLKPSGSWVEADEAVLEIETDKSVMEVVAPEAGYLHQVAEKGALLQVESLLGYVLEEGEEPPAAPAEDRAEDRNEAAKPSGAAPGPPPPPTPRRGGAASPIARRLAAEHGIDLDSIDGTGPRGRIVEADVRAAIERAGGAGQDQP